MATSANVLASLNDADFEKDVDVIGGTFAAYESDIYKATVVTAYITESRGGAIGVVLNLKFSGHDDIYRETVYITNKEKKNFFVKDGKKIALPGYRLFNDLCLLTCDNPVNKMATDETMVKIYDYEAKKEVPRSVTAFPDLKNKEVYVAIMQVVENKRTRDPSSGEYIATADKHTFNTIKKFMDVNTGKTVLELTDNKDANFGKEWKNKYKGYVQNNYKEPETVTRNVSAAVSENTSKNVEELFG